MGEEGSETKAKENPEQWRFKYAPKLEAGEFFYNSERTSAEGTLA